MKHRVLSVFLAFAMVIAASVFVGPGIPASAETIAADENWYDPAAAELVIEDAADFLAFMEKLAESNPTVKPDDLTTVTGNSAFAGQTIKLAADIDLNPGWTVPADISDMTSVVSPPTNSIVGASGTQKAFAGVFDGQGHTVSGLYIDASSASHGSVFGVAKSVDGKAVEVKNVAFVNSYITSKNLGMASLFTGVEKASALDIDNVYVDIDLYSGSTAAAKTQVSVGGLVSTVGGTLNVSNSVYVGVIDAGVKVTRDQISHYGCGGLVFLVQGTAVLENCGFFGKINWTCGQRVAKIVGRIENNGDLTLTRCIAGGVQNNGDPAVNQSKFGSTNNATVLGNFVFTAANGGYETKVTASDVIYVPMNGLNYGGSDPVILSSPAANGTGNKWTFNKTRLVKITAEELNGTSAVLKTDGYDLSGGWTATESGVPLPTAMIRANVGGAADRLNRETAYVGYQVKDLGNGSYLLRFVGVGSDLSYGAVGLRVTVEAEGYAPFTVEGSTTTTYDLVKSGERTVYDPATYGGNYFFLLKNGPVTSGLGVLTVTVTTFHVADGVSHNDRVVSFTIDTANLAEEANAS